MTASKLFTRWKVGPYTVPNRVLMAPMTRCRAGMGAVPTPIMAEYYAQRAGAGLLITEACQISIQGTGHAGTPGMFNSDQADGWRAVTEAVHARGGRIFAQLWHVGRSSHPLFPRTDGPPVSSSAVPISGETPTPKGPMPHPTPRALELGEISGVVGQFRHAAEIALLSGFDGVELHGANGYLPDQFLRDGVNMRTDEYGGPIPNRARFHLEVTRALAEVWGADRVGVRLSPCGTYNDMRDSDPRATFGYLIAKLNEFDLAYLHLMEAMHGDVRHGGENIPVGEFRPLFRGNIVANSGFSRDKAEAYLEAGYADAVAWGTLFLANPDLPERLRQDAPLNIPNPKTFYSGGERGYTDYPSMMG